MAKDNLKNLREKSNSIDFKTGIASGFVVGAFSKREGLKSLAATASVWSGIVTSTARFSDRKKSFGQKAMEDLGGSLLKVGGAVVGAGAAIIALKSGKSLSKGIKSVKKYQSSKTAKQSVAKFTKSKPKSGYRDVTPPKGQITFIRKNGRVIPVRKK